ncbi:MAG: DUF1902 domain-containing protein [Gammaproteobacteria bacterium]
MDPKNLVVKCYAEKEGNCWVAVCLNFNLAAQGETFEEVKCKLEAMITEYVYDALVGEDRAYAAQLLSRRSPLSTWIKYQFIRLKASLGRTQEQIFDEIMPLRPA